MIEDAVETAIREWKHWGSHSIDLTPGAQEPAAIPKSDTDKNAARAQYILDKYCPTANSETTVAKIVADKYAWSGATISFFFKYAEFEPWRKMTGLGFPFSAGHRKWIKLAVKAAREEASFMYHAFPVTHDAATPKIGDLVAYARRDSEGHPIPTFEQAQHWFDRTADDDKYNSHSDLVVGFSEKWIEVIGGNVDHTVCKKIIPLDFMGRIADRSKPWFAVLRKVY
ncbi:MAG: hypothetical protein K0S57_3416 [Ramlibacter sp.]|jgi:hypothetical protein|nr:hypothetical protein [Ramlibacter sp.]